MLNNLEKSHILVDGLFLNAGAGFDCDVLRGALREKEIIANICINSINGEEVPMTSLSMMNCMPKGFPSNEPKLGWTVSGHY